MNSDATLVRNLRGPESQQAARSLYRSYGGELYGFALRRLRDQGLAEELVQDVFTRAWRSAEQFEPSHGSVRTWLYAIARNAVIDSERRRGRRPQLPVGESEFETVDPAGPIETVDPVGPIETALLRYQIQLGISRLTFEHRQVIELVHFRGLSLAEIAQQTGLPLGTVKSRLYYATRSLRLALEELEVIHE